MVRCSERKIWVPALKILFLVIFQNSDLLLASAFVLLLLSGRSSPLKTDSYRTGRLEDARRDVGAEAGAGHHHVRLVGRVERLAGTAEENIKRCRVCCELC